MLLQKWHASLKALGQNLTMIVPIDEQRFSHAYHVAVPGVNKPPIKDTQIQAPKKSKEIGIGHQLKPRKNFGDVRLGQNGSCRLRKADFIDRQFLGSG